MKKFWLWLANRMPRQLVYWCLIRALAHATTGRWSEQRVCDVKAKDVVNRWMPFVPVKGDVNCRGPHGGWC